MNNDKPGLFSLANRHRVITQVIAGLLLFLILGAWSRLSSSIAAKRLNEGFAATWNWITNQSGAFADALSADVTIARWQMLIFLLVFTALILVAVLPRIRKTLKSRRFIVALNDALDMTLNDVTRRFGLPRLTVSVADSKAEVAEEQKQPALERREELALMVLAVGDWPFNEANAKQVAAKLKGSVHPAELALSGLFDKGYVKDRYHTGTRWFKLSPKGQEYAIKEELVKDLDFPF
jgi:hypothetical protein